MKLWTKGRISQATTPEQQAALDAPDEFLLSIVTINRNNARNLLRTLKSLEQMRFDPEVERIFIDGASTDDSVAIARGFYRPEDVISEPDTGIYNAMNKGLYRARGKYVLWLNSGDELIEGAHDFLLETLRDASGSVIAFGVEVMLANRDGENRATTVCPARLNRLPRGTLCHQGAVFLRKQITQMCGYDESLRVVADRELLLRLYFSGYEIRTRPEIVSRFYSGGVSSSRRHYIESIRVNRRYGLLNTHQYYLRVGKYCLMIIPVLGRLVR